MEFTVNYPGSFGEILQGKVCDKDLLLSCPVDVYTKVKVFESNNVYKRHNIRKSSAFLSNILELWEYNQYNNIIDIEIDSKIPYGKGMASSTADLCGVYYCLLKMFNKEFNETELMEQCIKIEPTDSIIFKDMTLFDYKKGLYRRKMGKYIEYNILAFEGNGVVDTVEFNSKNLVPLSNVDDLVPILEEGISESNIEKIAYVSTESIMRNQKRLYYDFLDKVVDIKNRTKGLGVMGAHSGNVLGIIYEDEEKLNYAKEFFQNAAECKVYSVKTLNSIEI